MPAETPAPLRRWWWRTPLAIRLLPATALLAATAATGISALPTSASPELAHPAPLPAAPPPPAPPVPTTTPTPTTTTTQPGPTTPPTTTTRTTTTTTTTTTQRPTPPPPRPRPNHHQEQPTPTPTTTRTSDDHDDDEDWVPVVTEKEHCSHEGDVARTPSGAAARCERDDDGELRWTTRW
ncbi:hypothetical protein ABT324_10255 [Saccharopolyspora sp. NPDC000359]|uniref:hypothetical protein n=1 Tax=Saccharopolyspora sp. NPDC000359 TaxID=3154251 RepID=UPI003326F726